jgi:hypothetical protein
VGADRLGKIPVQLSEKGYSEIIHWTGRSKSYLNKSIPKEVDVIILFWDFLNHNLMQQVKRQAKAQGIPLVFSKRNITVPSYGVLGRSSGEVSIVM